MSLIILVLLCGPRGIVLPDNAWLRTALSASLVLDRNRCHSLGIGKDTSIHQVRMGQWLVRRYATFDSV